MVKLFGKTLRLNQSFLLDQQDQYISHLVQDQPNAISILTQRIRSAQRSAQLSGFNRPAKSAHLPYTLHNTSSLQNIGRRPTE